MKKLHLGNGGIYLKDYINIDMSGVSSRLRPDVAKHNLTTIDKYFKYPYRDNMNNDCYDIKMDVLDLSVFDDNSIDEILTVNLVEHLFKRDFLKAAEEHWHRVLKPKGILIIDTPDIVGNAQKLVEAKTFERMEEILNYIHCHGRTPYAIHRWGYTPEYLTYLLKPIGFKWLKQDNNYIKHDIDYSTFINFYEAVK